MKRMMAFVFVAMLAVVLPASSANQYFAGSNGSTQIYIDTTGHLNFVDPFLGPLTLTNLAAANGTVITPSQGIFGTGTLSGFPNMPLGFVGNVNSYLQLVGQNNNAGGIASTDIVLTSNNGTDSTYYLDLGINSSGFSQSASSNSYTTSQSTGSYLYASNAGLSLGTLDTTSNGWLMFFSSATYRGAFTNYGTFEVGVSTNQWATDTQAVHVSSGAFVLDGTGANMTVGGSLTVAGASTLTGAVAVSSNTVLSGFLQLFPRTLAQLQALTPAAVGQVYFCSNCVASVCVSSGTAVDQFQAIASTSTVSPTACK